jgi:TPR repeat protein
MYSDIDWTKEPNLEELRTAYALFATDFDLARSKLEELANRGSVASMWYLGDAYSRGEHVAKHFAKAKIWYGRAEASGSIAASFRLGRACYALLDYGPAFEAFSRGAAKGYLPAVYRLGMMYKEGLGTKRDLNECRRLLEVAVSEGHLFAKRDLAWLCMTGAFGARKIPKGIWMAISLMSNLIMITISGEWRKPAFEDRTLA